jgi:hypothetical protein
MRLMRPGVAFICLLLFSATWPSEVSAQGDVDERAAEHFRLGQEYLTDNRFEDALREFREAYRLSERVEMIFNEAVALEKLQRWGDAADAYDRSAPALHWTTSASSSFRMRPPTHRPTPSPTPDRTRPPAFPRRRSATARTTTATG